MAIYSKLKNVNIFIITVIVLLNPGCIDPGEQHTESRSIDVGSAETVLVLIEMNAGDLNISGGANDLLNSEFTYNSHSLKPEVEYRICGSQGKLKVWQHMPKRIIHRHDIDNEWNMHLHNTVPLMLSINHGAGCGNFELGGLNMNWLDINLGAGKALVNLSGSRSLTKLNLQLGAGEALVDLSDSRSLTSFNLQIGAGEALVDLTGNKEEDLNIDIEGGIGELTLLLPGDTGVCIDATHGIGEIRSSGMKKDGHTYTNEAFNRSEVTMNIDIEVGIGEINLEVEPAQGNNTIF